MYKQFIIILKRPKFQLVSVQCYENWALSYYPLQHIHASSSQYALHVTKRKNLCIHPLVNVVLRPMAYMYM